MEYVILVDENDNEVGTIEKIEAHEKALLHRAISVFIINSKNELLLQQRASSKYHSPDLWTNTCCSHPRPGENTLDAALRRLQEEMGIQTSLEKVLSFQYKAPFDNGLTEHEYDHVFVGYTDENPVLNPEEAKAYKYVSMDIVNADIIENPQNYTAWFKIIFEEFYNKISA